MDTSEVTSEGAVFHFTRYDLEVLHSALATLIRDANSENFEAETGCALLEVRRMFEKVSRTYTMVLKS